ncbi:pilus assembly protein TadG-related protein [Bosea sp. PAMC 26642]|uniref:pilus assembly protein TadG-related protein n=1 Tax=Bosea sp. (strain PAMC 26642) TaxID=1792307 RepID=UPI00143985A3|nr:pilus assembly protein TadG-related protein [Bosea sp. PAMC 26642]
METVEDTVKSADQGSISEKRRRKVAAFGRLAGDERGFTLVFFAVALPALLGIVGLVIDLGRLYTLDTQLANAADAAALAAARQLDRTDGALQKARDAAKRMTNTPSFGANADLGLSFRFAANLADLRDSPSFTLADVNGAAAVYVEVTTSRHSLTASFIQFVGAQTESIRRKATAESQYYACDVTPLMMCQRDPARFVASASSGRQYLLRNAATMADGSLVTFDAPGDGNGTTTPQRLASNRPAFCYTNTINYRSGVLARQFDDAINVRFDRYAQANAPIAPELAAFPPAPTIIKGQRYQSCMSPPNAAEINPPYHLPRDSAFRRIDETARYDDGSGDWRSTLAYGGSGANVASALDEYILWNHGDKSPVFQGSLRSSSTRYEIYLKELGLSNATETTPVVATQQNALAATLPTGGPTTGSYGSLSEAPTQRCYAGREPANEPRRRVLYIAIVDCAGFDRNATAAKLSRYVGKFFLTEPANAGTMLVEFLNWITPSADDDKLRHIVQLVETG